MPEHGASLLNQLYPGRSQIALFQRWESAICDRGHYMFTSTYHRAEIVVNIKTFLTISMQNCSLFVVESNTQSLSFLE